MRGKVNKVQELEDKLNDLSNARQEDHENFNKCMYDWEIKYAATQDNLSFQITSLTEKLNSLAEFPAQYDVMKAKQDAQVQEQEQKHKAELYKMERKVIVDTQRTRKDVENQMINFSTEFTKASELRIPATTQRLVRENITLKNEMDRMTSSQDRLQRENEKMMKEMREYAGLHEANIAENKQLVKADEQRLRIITQLTNEYESLLGQKTQLQKMTTLKEVGGIAADDNNLVEMKEKIKTLKQHIHVIDCDRQRIKADFIYHRNECDRVSDIITSAGLSVKSAINPIESQHKNLLPDLLDILNDLEKHGTKPSLETITSIQNFFTIGDLGIIPENDVDTIIQALPSLKIDDNFLTPSILSVESEETFESEKVEEVESENELLDPVSASGSFLFASESESDVAEEDEKLVHPTQMLLRKSFGKERDSDDDENDEGTLSEIRDEDKGEETFLGDDKGEESPLDADKAEEMSLGEDNGGETPSTTRDSLNKIEM